MHKGNSSSASSDAAKDQKNRKGQPQSFTRSSGGGKRVENMPTKGNPGNHRLPK